MAATNENEMEEHQIVKKLFRSPPTKTNMMTLGETITFLLIIMSFFLTLEKSLSKLEIWRQIVGVLHVFVPG